MAAPPTPQRRRRNSFADRGAHAAEKFEASDSEAEELQRLRPGADTRRRRTVVPLDETESDWVHGRDEEYLVEEEGDLVTQLRLISLRQKLHNDLPPEVQVCIHSQVLLML